MEESLPEDLPDLPDHRKVWQDPPVKRPPARRAEAAAVHHVPHDSFAVDLERRAFAPVARPLLGPNEAVELLLLVRGVIVVVADHGPFASCVLFRRRLWDLLVDAVLDGLVDALRVCSR